MGGGWGGGVGGVPRWSRECAQAPLGSPGAGASRATHVRTREDGDVCQWPQVLASAGHCSSQQRLLAARLSAGGTARVGRRPVWPGEGWQHGSGRPRGQVKPPLRAATPTPRHPRDHRPWLRWLLLPAGSQGLLLLLLRARGQVPSGRSRRQGVHCGWIAALQAEDPQPWVLVVPLASLCCPPPTTPLAPGCGSTIDLRRSSHTRGGRNIEVSWPFLVGFSATG